jgi:hypothetical protein
LTGKTSKNAFRTYPIFLINPRLLFV